MRNGPNPPARADSVTCAAHTGIRPGRRRPARTARPASGPDCVRNRSRRRPRTRRRPVDGTALVMSPLPRITSGGFRHLPGEDAPDGRGDPRPVPQQHAGPGEHLGTDPVRDDAHTVRTGAGEPPPPALPAESPSRMTTTGTSSWSPPSTTSASTSWPPRSGCPRYGCWTSAPGRRPTSRSWSTPMSTRSTTASNYVPTSTGPSSSPTTPSCSSTPTSTYFGGSPNTPGSASTSDSSRPNRPEHLGPRHSRMWSPSSPNRPRTPRTRSRWPSTAAPSGTATDRRPDRRTPACRRGGTGDRVALALDRSPELIAVVLGIARAGAASVPLDTSYPAWRLHLTLEQAQPVRVISDHTHAHLAADPENVLLLETVTGRSHPGGPTPIWTP